MISAKEMQRQKRAEPRENPSDVEILKRFYVKLFDREGGYIMCKKTKAEFIWKWRRRFDGNLKQKYKYRIMI